MAIQHLFVFVLISTCVTIQHSFLRLATGQRPLQRVPLLAWKKRYVQHCSSFLLSVETMGM
jgi:hypothetical protein